MKRVAIMQPYFLPYIGYWQLITSVDVFVVYDNIQYTKKGWFNRNRFLQNGHDSLFSIALKKDSDYLDVKDRLVSPEFDRSKLINQLKAAYGKAPQFQTVMPLMEAIIRYEDDNLFGYIHNSIRVICDYLGIETEIVVSSTVDIDHELRADQKVLAICQALGADMYINAIGGIELYDKAQFMAQGVKLEFIKAQPIEYQQFGEPFVPWLSIVDVLMFNDQATVKQLLTKYDLV